VRSVRAFEADTLARLRLHFFDVLRREAELKNAREDMALMESVRSRIALRVETGEAPRFELIKAEAETLNAQKSAQAAGFRVEQARSLLRQSVGGGLPADFSLRGQLSDVPDLPPLEGLRRQLQETSPDLARVRAEMVRAQHQLDLERRAALAESGPEGEHGRGPGYAHLEARPGRFGSALGPT
jgi:cobalt-zinc-cadmium efflux system outer membrane protein